MTRLRVAIYPSPNPFPKEGGQNRVSGIVNDLGSGCGVGGFLVAILCHRFSSGDEGGFDLVFFRLYV